MSRWFRHYAGLARDDKLVRAAMRCKQPIERVVWVWCAILESAAELDDGGRYELDHAECAYFLRTDEGDIAAVEDALRSCGRLAEGVVERWSDRQFQSDRSAERTKRYRERQRQSRDGAEERASDRVTSHNVARDVTVTHHRTETETETEKAAVGRARDLAAIADALLEAGGRALNRTTAGLMVLAEPLRWLNAGCDLDLDILPVIRSRSARAGPSSIRSWAFFTEEIAAAHQRRTAPMPTVDTHHQPTRPSNDIAAAFDRLDARIAAHSARDRE